MGTQTASREPEDLRKLPALGANEEETHSAVSPCLVPTPERGRGSHPVLGGHCHLQGLTIYGLWSSALGPAHPQPPPPPSAPQTSGPTQVTCGKKTPDSSRNGLWWRAMTDRVQPENSRLLWLTKPPSRLSLFLPPSDDKVAISGPARALAPVGKPLDEEDTCPGVCRAPPLDGLG